MNEQKTGFIIRPARDSFADNIFWRTQQGEVTGFVVMKDGVKEVQEVPEGKEAPAFLRLTIGEMQNLYVALGNHLRNNRALPIELGQEQTEKHLSDMRKIAFHKLGIKEND